MNRHLKAFLIAPLVVPGLMLPFLFPTLPAAPWIFGLGLVIAAMVSYAGVVLLGAPAYVALRSHGWTGFWIAPVVGFAAGVITGIVAVAVAVHLTLPDAAPIGALISRSVLSPSWNTFGLGTYGALVGVALWLIGRPDRP